MNKYSIIIPVYNGELTIAELVQKIIDFFNSNIFNFEIILIYDCGYDNSWQQIVKLKHKYKGLVKGIRLTRNFGQHNALIAGFIEANGDFIVTMDEDLQHNPHDIIHLINKQKEGNFDLVYGSPIITKHSFSRNITSFVLKKIVAIGIPELHNDYSAFRLVKTQIAKKTIEMNNSYTFVDGFLSWITTNVSSVEVSHSPRFAGKSSYNIKKLLNHAINIFVTFSVFPIRILTFSSIIIFILSLIYAGYLLIRKIFYNDLITGYASTMIILGIGFGLAMFGLGILGEYIYRISLKTTKRPNFIISEKI